MPNNNNKNKSKSRSRRPGRKLRLMNSGPTPGSLTYSGPAIPRITEPGGSTYVLQLHYITALATGGGVTVLNPVFANDPSGSSEWSSCQALFDSYRVLAMELKFIPASYVGTGLTGGTLLIVSDYEDATALASQAAALQYDSVQLRNIGTTTNPSAVGWRYGPWKARGNNMLWSSTLTGMFTQAVGSIKCRADSLTATTGYGAIVLYWLVQFRGRQ